MKNFLKYLFIGLAASSLMACSAQTARVPLQAAGPGQQLRQAPQLRSLNNPGQFKTYRFKLQLSAAEFSQLEDSFMLNATLSADLMTFYFSHPQFREVYSNTFISTREFRQLQAAVISFDVFDRAAFEQQALPQIKSMLEVQGRQLVAVN